MVLIPTNVFSKTLQFCCVILLLGSGCDVVELNDQRDILNGRWASNIAAVSGVCCHLDLTLETEDGEVIGTGIVETPGQRVGVSEEFTIQVVGTIIDDRVRLELASTNNPGLIEGALERNANSSTNIVLDVNFEGFGFEGRDIVLFPRATP